ncbi:MAG: hypothetical protein AAFQ95_01165 [Cyanobacteria bacterium J06621_3]
MVISRNLSSILVAALLTAFVFVSPVSLALSLPTGQPIEKTATLIGPKENSPIPLYLRPAANQPNVGYGVNGSSVTVTEQISGYLPEADQNSAWNHIRLDSPPYTEGWVQGRFLSIPDAETASE